MRIQIPYLEDAVLRHPDVADAAVFGVIFFKCYSPEFYRLFMDLNLNRCRNRQRVKCHVVFM